MKCFSFICLSALYTLTLLLGQNTLAVTLDPTVQAVRAEAEKLTPLLVRPLHIGMSGNDIVQLQRFLRAYGTYMYPAITGYFGPHTKQAVIKFQKNENIDARGIAGPATEQKIMDIAQQTESPIPTVQANSTPQPLGASITTAVISDSVDETGKTTTPKTAFASTTPTLWATLSLTNAKQTTALSYIRYYQDIMIDYGTTHPSADDVSLSHFQWSLKPGIQRTVGTYTIVLYVDGARSETLTYTIF